ncbi:MAG: type II toxin-antitoxin system CcdA family antitoxin [Azoarcus sp.]|jgi:antitoxin CcdA|nr:type II toxin-antitoxin system CcdA family antitoxin [Azoarcus sp.]
MLDLASTRHTRSSSRSPRRATNLSLSPDVLEAAKALNINISQTCDEHLRKVVKEEQARRWCEEYADFFVAYNEALTTEGLPLDEWKTF